MGKIYAWGDNSQGQLGAGDYKKRATPFEITGMEYCLALVCYWYSISEQNMNSFIISCLFTDFYSSIPPYPSIAIVY